MLKECTEYHMNCTYEWAEMEVNYIQWHISF